MDALHLTTGQSKQSPTQVITTQRGSRMVKLGSKLTVYELGRFILP